VSLIHLPYPEHLLISSLLQGLINVGNVCSQIL
jgi:hypothetical protein